MADAGRLELALKSLLDAIMRNSMHGFIHYAKDRGLSMPQINMLFRLHHKGPSGVSDIGDELGVTSAAASQMLDRLFQQGLVLRSEDPRDRRLKQIVLTQKGEALLDQAVDARQQWIEALTVRLSPAEQERVISAIDLLVAQMRQVETSHAAEKACAAQPK